MPQMFSQPTGNARVVNPGHEFPDVLYQVSATSFLKCPAGTSRDGHTCAPWRESGNRALRGCLLSGDHPAFVPPQGGTTNVFGVAGGTTGATFDKLVLTPNWFN